MAERAVYQQPFRIAGESSSLRVTDENEMARVRSRYLRFGFPRLSGHLHAFLDLCDV